VSLGGFTNLIKLNLDGNRLTQVIFFFHVDKQKSAGKGGR
jgi:hypothetical protein